MKLACHTVALRQQDDPKLGAEDVLNWVLDVSSGWMGSGQTINQVPTLTPKMLLVRCDRRDRRDGADSGVVQYGPAELFRLMGAPLEELQPDLSTAAWNISEMETDDGTA